MWFDSTNLHNFTCDSTFLAGRYKSVGISRLGRNRRRYVPDLTGGNKVIGTIKNLIPCDSEVGM